MRRLPIIIVLITTLITSLSACSNTLPESKKLPKADAVLAGLIIQSKNGSCLIAGSGASDLYTVSAKIAVYDAGNNAAAATALKAGQSVEIGYSGSIMESYPAQLGSPIYIKITGEGDDMVGFYQTILNDIWNVDEGLNSDISVLAFDLSQVTNLTDAEKSALAYVVGGSHSLPGIIGTFEELREQGYIDKEKLYFKNGLLFEFELADVTPESFTFDVKKWRSGDGAYIFHNCKASKTDYGWSYTVGSEMIS